MDSRLGSAVSGASTPDVLKQPGDRVNPDKTNWPMLVRKIKELGLPCKEPERVGHPQFPGERRARLA
jgi:hypothetical protein